MITASMHVQKGAKDLGSMYPARWFYRKHEEEPTTETAIRRSIADDLYLVLATQNVEQQTATIKIVINPLINWIWFGVGVIIFGSFIAILPERAFAFAEKRVPDTAATTTLMVLLIVGLAGTGLKAQHIELPQSVAIIPRTPLEKDLQSEIICMCGTCGRKKIGECTCQEAADMRAQLATFIQAGKSRPEIIDAFVKEYGSQEVLAQPIDEGFNRLAWLLPYATGVLGMAAIGGVAWRWSRHGTSDAAVETPVTIDAETESRLDDELRDLD
jgi:cytochrome c-type biogenesis protein CcmF